MSREIEDRFDQLIENGLAGEDELGGMVDIVDQLKKSQPHPATLAQMRSERRMLAESERVRQAIRERRISRLGSLYGWAVPAILLLAVFGVVFGNSRQNEPATPEPGSSESSSGVLTTVDTSSVQEIDEPQIEATATVTPSLSLTRTIPNDSQPAADPLASDLNPYPSPANVTEDGEVESISVPDGEGGEIEVVVPIRPLAGTNIEPPEGGDSSTIVTPRPGDGREGGRNPDS